MISRLIHHLVPDEPTWDRCVEIFAGLPVNY